MSRPWLWLQLVLGWLPVWVLYALLASPANPIHSDISLGRAVITGLIAVVTAAALSPLVQRFSRRFPWPHPFRPGFAALQVLAAVAFSVAWLGIKGAFEILIQRQSAPAFHFWLLPTFVLGIWLYLVVAGVSYAAQASERAVLAEASAARLQLAALRAQLNPHFLFNALHTVVQLIPREPGQASRAAEQIAELLRTTIEEDRDLVTLAEERAFVERYLALERIRFGERLRVRIDTTDEAESTLLPTFALQTLVENAVRHGAAPRVEPTEVSIEAAVTPQLLRVTVRDSGAGASPEQLALGGGTGLQRLKERLAALYGDTARLELESKAAGGFVATLLIPRVPPGMSSP